MFDLQKKSNFYKMKLRNIDREVEPVFSTLLLVVCAFMAVILIGAGSIFGGLLFLVPLAIAAHAYWDSHRAAPEDEA
jgi:hypothetical protein